MNLFQRCAVVLCVLMLSAGYAGAKSSEIIESIDTPTANVYDYGAYNINFRLFSGDSTLARMNFGVFKIINLGFGWELTHLVGNQNIVVAPPTLNLKARIFPGGLFLPSLAIGYDGQGSYYSTEAVEFAQKGRGIFLVTTRELLFPGCELSVGGNMNDFKTNNVYGFASVTINMEDVFVVMAEYDNIHYAPDNRLNGGFRFALTGDLSVDLAGRDVLGSGPLSKERIIRVNYTSSF